MRVIQCFLLNERDRLDGKVCKYVARCSWSVGHLTVHRASTEQNRGESEAGRRERRGSGRILGTRAGLKATPPFVTFIRAYAPACAQVERGFSSTPRGRVRLWASALPASRAGD